MTAAFWPEVCVGKGPLIIMKPLIFWSGLGILYFLWVLIETKLLGFCIANSMGAGLSGIAGALILVWLLFWIPGNFGGFIKKNDADFRRKFLFIGTGLFFTLSFLGRFLTLPN